MVSTNVCKTGVDTVKAKAIFVFIILSFLTLLSAESAVASPDSTARSERQRYIVDGGVRWSVQQVGKLEG